MSGQAAGPLAPRLRHAPRYISLSHALTIYEPNVCVSPGLVATGLTITSRGSITAEEIDKGQLIDKHYYAIATKATLLTPDKLNVRIVYRTFSPVTLCILSCHLTHSSTAPVRWFLQVPEEKFKKQFGISCFLPESLSLSFPSVKIHPSTQRRLASL